MFCCGSDALQPGNGSKSIAMSLISCRRHRCSVLGAPKTSAHPKELAPRPSSCDTFVALPPTTLDGSVIFGKNSDRQTEACSHESSDLLSQITATECTARSVVFSQPTQEVQEVVAFPAVKYPEAASLRCTYIEIPQAKQTCAVVLSKPSWMWGAEMGANEVNPMHCTSVPCTSTQFELSLI